MSLNVGGGARLIKPAKLYTCTQKHYKHKEDGRTAPGVRGHGSVPLTLSTNGFIQSIRTEESIVLLNGLNLNRFYQESLYKTISIIIL